MPKMTDVIVELIMAIVLLIVILTLLADMGPDMAAASNNITAQSSTFPLTNLFKPKGLIYLILMVAVFIGIIVLFFDLFKGKK